MDQEQHIVSEEKSGNPRINFNWSGDFFCFYLQNLPGHIDTFFKEDDMAARELSFSKITIFFIKDWDCFQSAMRGCLFSLHNQEQRSGERKSR